MITHKNHYVKKTIFLGKTCKSSACKSSAQIRFKHFRCIMSLSLRLGALVIQYGSLYYLYIYYLFKCMSHLRRGVGGFQRHYVGTANK